MRVQNVHSRTLEASKEEVGALIDGLAGDDDRLWPTDAWPAMRLDGRLAVGAKGGHAFVKYAVDAYEPGRRVVFRFAEGLGIVGTHSFTVHPVGARSTRLEHSLEGRLKGWMLLGWPLFIRPLHDALVEDGLDRAELEVTGRIERPARWGPRVRALRYVLARLPSGHMSGEPRATLG